MDRNEKFIRKLNAKENQRIQDVIKQILSGNLADLQVKKLKGFDDAYRVRVGRIRIIFSIGERTIIRQISSRDDNTYRDF